MGTRNIIFSSVLQIAMCSPKTSKACPDPSQNREAGQECPKSQCSYATKSTVERETVHTMVSNNNPCYLTSFAIVQGCLESLRLQMKLRWNPNPCNIYETSRTVKVYLKLRKMVLSEMTRPQRNYHKYPYIKIKIECLHSLYTYMYLYKDLFKIIFNHNLLTFADFYSVKFVCISAIYFYFNCKRLFRIY